jgi:hypothetical protein
MISKVSSPELDFQTGLCPLRSSTGTPPDGHYRMAHEAMANQHQQSNLTLIGKSRRDMKVWIRAKSIKNSASLCEAFHLSQASNALV